MREPLTVRIVRTDEELIIPHHLDYVWQHLLFRIGADPDIACKVLARRPPHLRMMALVAKVIVEPLEPLAHPSGLRLHGANPQLRKALKYAVEHHGRESKPRILGHVHRYVHHPGDLVPVPSAARVLKVEADVNADRHVEILGSCPDRVEVRMAETLASYRYRGDKRGTAAQLRHPVEFTDCELRITQGNMGARVQAVLVGGS